MPGPGANLIRNGSFEGSSKYAAQGGEWRKKRGRAETDGTTAAAGKYSLTKEVFATGAEWNGLKIYDSGFEFAPFLCKWDALYCVSFFGKADKTGAPLQSHVRGMLHTDNTNDGKYPQLEGNPALTTEWQRYHYFFPANRIKNDSHSANSYYLTIGTRSAGDPGCTRIWIDGVQVEEVAGFDTTKAKQMTERKQIPRQIEGYPTVFKLYAPVEVCAETIEPPRHNLYTEKENVAKVRAAIVNGETAQTVQVVWKLLDYRQKQLWVSAPQTKELNARENWLPEQNVTLTRKGALLVRTEVTNLAGTMLNFSDEPVTVLPFDLSGIGNGFDERFGINLSFADEHTPDEQNAGLSMLRRVGFRWVRNGGHSDFTVNYAHERGFRQFVSIFGYPKSVQQGSFPHTLPKDMNWPFGDPRWDDLSIETAFDKELRDMAIRYKGKVDAYQFGNETTNAKAGDPKIAFRVCRRAAKIIRSADPAAKIIGASIIYQWKIDWWKEVMKLGGLDDMDYFGWDFDCYVMGGSSFEDMMTMRKAMRESSGGKEVPPFNYESGWGSGWMQDYPADPIGGARLDYGSIPGEMTRTFAGIFAGGDTHFILHLAAYQENFMGAFWSCTRWPVQLYDEQERPRVTLAAYNVAIKFLGLSDYRGRISSPGGKIEGYAFTDRRENRPVLVYWAREAFDAPRELSLKIESSELSACDVMGNAVPLRKNDDGTWRATLPPKREPLYLLGAIGTPAQALIDGFERLP